MDLPTAFGAMAAGGMATGFPALGRWLRRMDYAAKIGSGLAWLLTRPRVVIRRLK